MGAVIEGIVSFLMRLRPAGWAFVLAWVALILWIAARRAGRKGLELAGFLLTSAMLAFTLAVFAPRPPMSEGLAVGLALLAAVFLVATAGTLIWLGVRRRRAPRVVKHSHPPWENGGW